MFSPSRGINGKALQCDTNYMEDTYFYVHILNLLHLKKWIWTVFQIRPITIYSYSLFRVLQGISMLHDSAISKAMLINFAHNILNNVLITSDLLKAILF